MRVRAGIVGFRGYSGAELVAILRKHPRAEPWLLEHRSDAGERPEPRGNPAPPRLPCDAEAVAREGIQCVFLATPPEVSMELAPKMLAAGAKVIDISGAFRLRTPENYRRWYGAEHTEPALLERAVYGLPEFYRERLRGADFIANPGCYPTAANLALRPLVRSGRVDLQAGLICDAKSGVSGAGRKPSLKTHFCEAAENFSAYSVLEHRHVPEVLMNSGLDESQFSFVAHLLPLDRGILETIYFRSRQFRSAADIVALYEQAYEGEPFVRLYDPGVVPDLRAVQRTNFCDLGARFDAATGRGVVVAAIDNLVKGAAGQAIQNMNLAFGLPETEGLL
jgi:N-acetyl-gamma-glutamyl-phosphate reductase